MVRLVCAQGRKFTYRVLLEKQNANIFVSHGNSITYVYDTSNQLST